MDVTLADPESEAVLVAVTVLDSETLPVHVTVPEAEGVDEGDKVCDTVRVLVAVEEWV